MFFHYAARKISPISKISNFFEDLSFLNPRSDLNMHDKEIINPPKDNITRTCNCIRKQQCPLNKKCLTINVLYKASITPNKENLTTKI